MFGDGGMDEQDRRGRQEIVSSCGEMAFSMVLLGEQVGTKWSAYRSDCGRSLLRHRKAFLESIRRMDRCAYYEYGGEVNEYKSELLILMIAECLKCERYP